MTHKNIMHKRMMHKRMTHKKMTQKKRRQKGGAAIKGEPTNPLFKDGLDFNGQHFLDYSNIFEKSNLNIQFREVIKTMLGTFGYILLDTSDDTTKQYIYIGLITNTDKTGNYISFGKEISENEVSEKKVPRDFLIPNSHVNRMCIYYIGWYFFDILYPKARDSALTGTIKGWIKENKPTTKTVTVTVTAPAAKCPPPPEPAAKPAAEAEPPLAAKPAPCIQIMSADDKLELDIYREFSVKCSSGKGECIKYNEKYTKTNAFIDEALLKKLTDSKQFPIRDLYVNMMEYITGNEGIGSPMYKILEAFKMIGAITIERHKKRFYWNKLQKMVDIKELLDMSIKIRNRVRNSQLLPPDDTGYYTAFIHNYYKQYTDLTD